MPTERRVVAALFRGLLGVLWWLLAGPLAAQTIESVLSPGPVIQGHAKNEHDCKSCHLVFDRTAQDGLCIECHKDVGQDVRQRRGYHGKRDPQACRSCHAEHRGRTAVLAGFDQKAFDHRLTNFELHDKHVGLECAKCHPAGKRWREAVKTCAGCHQKDDVHKGGLGRKCEDCHNERSWKETDFDHDRKTHFALAGKHAEAKCTDCHLQGKYKDTPKACIACHRKKDEHKGQYGEKCETCHGVKSWKPSSFNHDTDTRYPLRDRHKAVKCSACHVEPLYKAKLGTACIDCHAKDDKHERTLGRKCEDCHVVRGWKESPPFDHAKSRFALRGAHAKVQCKDCHADALYRKTPSQCVECHRKDDRHKGNVGTDCQACHGETDWKTTEGRFDHQRSKFPLRNAHAARSVKCQDCHETLAHLRGVPTTCIGCHRRDDRHEGTLGEKCDTCHRDVDWRVPRFDHSRTRYPLAGGHVVAPCKACHQTLRFKDAPQECLACHRKDDVHKARLGEKCMDCHNVRAWSLWTFDHDRATRYPLDGRHRQVKCEACHSQPTPNGRGLVKLATECIACHRKADTHEGRFGRRCEQCHMTEGWRLIRPATAARSVATPLPASAPAGPQSR